MSLNIEEWVYNEIDEELERKKMKKLLNKINEEEEKKKMKSKVLKKVTQGYMKVSTIHGLSYIAEEGRPLFEK